MPAIAALAARGSLWVMFTGLITAVGTVVGTRETDAGRAIEVRTEGWPCRTGPEQPFQRGESIAVSGCCLTLVRFEQSRAAGAEGRSGVHLGFDVIPETMRKTTLGSLRVGMRVHLERSATPTTLLGGHLVQGHVDAVGRVERVDSGAERRIRISVPASWLGCLAPHGSIAVDGTSLTVAAIDDGASTFDVCLIPETIERTELGSLRVGDAANVEFDCIAKMVARSVAALTDMVRPPVRRPSA